MSRSPLNNILNTEESVHQINTFLQSVQMLLEAASHIERIETENERRYTLTMTPARINVNAIVHHCRDGAMGERLCK
ncbi:hypothetical protein scyTo_0011400 [Scyliorhinus torazame]|uniref:Uncharacterized protein n=1 Tax=Scyliorhinus torazame TaxID=75743 RepID=A0A401NM46_SCYTO|nr:hypothetical protein [Scyliorhinus torazame]